MDKFRLQNPGTDFVGTQITIYNAICECLKQKIIRQLKDKRVGNVAIVFDNTHSGDIVWLKLEHKTGYVSNYFSRSHRDHAHCVFHFLQNGKAFVSDANKNGLVPTRQGNACVHRCLDSWYRLLFIRKPIILYVFIVVFVWFAGGRNIFNHWDP